jgi:hypothetical protein
VVVSEQLLPRFKRRRRVLRPEVRVPDRVVGNRQTVTYGRFDQRFVGKPLRNCGGGGLEHCLDDRVAD